MDVHIDERSTAIEKFVTEPEIDGLLCEDVFAGCRPREKAKGVGLNFQRADLRETLTKTPSKRQHGVH